MAVQRQEYWLGGQRIDVAHLRAIESGVAYDLDVTAGVILAGKQPLVVEGFGIIATGAIGRDAAALILQVAGSSLIHFEASEAGSVFRVEDTRPAETLAATNPRIIGSFTPGVVNFIGIDLVRQADDQTSDIVQFLDPESNAETPVIVPLARELDYRIIISTTEFAATPGILPIAKVVTDATNHVTQLVDARWLMFRLGAGGSNPLSVNPFSWPGGRTEATAAGGDRSIMSLKDWLNATMTRMWELGGGEFWFSNTADRNVRFGSAGSVFASTGEPLEWDGTNLHWQVLRFVFDNSTGAVNEVAAQLTSVSGLTNLADGECVYVDVDRTEDRTVAGADPLVAQKGVLRTLGGSATPGQRYVIAWRTGAAVYLRDQPYPVGSSLKLATTLSAGAVKASVDPYAPTWTPDEPVAAIINMRAGDGFCATAGGVSHNTDSGSGHLVTAADIRIGRGAPAGDHNVLLTTIGDPYSTTITSTRVFDGNTRSAALNVELVESSPNPDGHVVAFGGSNGVDSGKGFVVETGGAVHLRNAVARPATPAPDANFPARTKLYARPTKVFKTNVRVITNAVLPFYTAAGAGIGKTLTATGVGVLTVDGVATVLNDRIGVKDETGGDAPNNGIYVVTTEGDGSTAFILTRATDADTDLEWPENSTMTATAGSANAGTYWKMVQSAVDLDADDLTFSVTDSVRRDEIVALWIDGSTSTIVQGPIY